MPENVSLHERIDRLEVHVAHQERTIEDLHKALTAQWHEIESLARKIGNLGSRVHAVEERTDAPAPVEPPPPHY